MKFVKTAALLFGLMFVAVSPVSAAGYEAKDATEAAQIGYASAPRYGFSDLRHLAAGVVIVGAGLGIGMLAKAAVESMARQPEVAGQINLSMIIAAAFIEGVAFFALIVIMIKNPY